MKRIFLWIICILFCLTIAGCQKSYQKEINEEINEIYFYHSGFGQRFPEYKINLQNKEFWKYTTGAGFDYVERDVLSENEGYSFVSNLDDENIAIFLRESARYGLTRWKETYMNNNVLDGHQWGITITFADGTSLTSNGSNKYPETWDKMYDAFINLTGEDILLFKRDWLNK